MSIKFYPTVNFLGDNSVFPGVTVFKDAIFKDGIQLLQEPQLSLKKH